MIDSNLHATHFNLERRLQEYKYLDYAAPHYYEAIQLRPEIARGESYLGDLLHISNC